MDAAHRDELRSIRTFPSLIRYLRDHLDWPVDSDDFDDVTFDYDPEELGLDAKVAAKIEQIRQLRPLSTNQPWGIFFLEFEPKRLPVVALRRVLRALVIRKRQGSSQGLQAAWNLHDLLFISAYGEDQERQITFAHFSEDPDAGDLPALRVLGWDDDDTALHLDRVNHELHDHLRWPEDETAVDDWREQWSAAFTLRHREAITTSQRLAVRLADLARVIRKRVNAALAVESDKGPLRKLMEAFKQALIHDLTEDDFADMYAQTVAYGLLSARVSRPAALVAENMTDMVPVSSPFLRELLETFINVGGRKSLIDFDELGINEVVEVLRQANMEAVLADFGNRNPQEDPVIHFYELFLKEYDPHKRMKRGVFYTPRPVVSFIVRSVDEILRTEFALADGLADTTTWGEMLQRHPDLKLPQGAKPEEPFVQILDPATGTGTFLVEVIEVIHNTMVARWKAEGCREKEIVDRWNEYVPRHLLPRLFGFELLMAPYAIAHMKIGLKLSETGYRFGSEARVGVYLTNALEPGETKTQVMFADLVAEEANAATVVKHRTPITVVIGNPPYAVSSANRGAWIQGLIADYKTGLNERKLNLDDDYIKFMRFGQWRIGLTGCGTTALITNNSYLDGLTHRQMRRSLLGAYGRLAFWNLHGDVERDRRRYPGSHDANVFDIAQGVAVSICTRGPSPLHPARVLFRETVGSRGTKYGALATALPECREWQPLTPNEPLLMLTPHDQTYRGEYEAHPSLADGFAVRGPGTKCERDGFCVAMDREEILGRVSDLLALGPEEVRAKYGLPEDSRDWTVAGARTDAQRTSGDSSLVVPFLYRPCDIRFTYFTGSSRGFAGNPGAINSRHVVGRGNQVLITTRQTRDAFDALVTCHASNHKALAAYDINALFPLYLYPDASSLETGEVRRPNLSPAFTTSLVSLLGLRFIPDGQGDLAATFGPEDVFHYIYAVLHSPTYRERYAEFLKIDFPRIPLPGSRELFANLCPLGQELVDLHLMRAAALDQTPARFDGAASPQVVKVTYDPDQQAVSINPQCRFTGIPPEVFEFHVGGYQVLEKWLKDRGPKKGNPGRVLTDDDLHHYCRVVMALQETIRLMARIDEVIEAHGGFPAAFATGTETQA